MPPRKKTRAFHLRPREVLWVFPFVGLLCQLATAQQDAGAYQAKAAYVYSFAKMTQWPAEALPVGSHLTICVLGGDEDFPRVLRETLAGKHINGHSVEIRRSSSAEDLKSCHVALLREPELDIPKTVASLERADVLLVGEGKEFLNQGGMISLMLSNGRVTYEINSRALDRAGLRYSDTTATRVDTGTVSAAQTEGSRSIKLRVLPEYPEIAAKMKISGAVQMQAVIRADGTVKEVHVIGGHPALAEAAVQAVIRWRFEPAPRETTESVKINFGQ